MLSHVPRFVTPGTVAHQAPLSMGFSRQEYWSRWPFPSPGDLLNPGIKPRSLESAALAGRFFITSTTWEAQLFLNVGGRRTPFLHEHWDSGCTGHPWRSAAGTWDQVLSITSSLILTVACAPLKPGLCSLRHNLAEIRYLKDNPSTSTETLALGCGCLFFIKQVPA